MSSGVCLAPCVPRGRQSVADDRRQRAADEAYQRFTWGHRSTRRFAAIGPKGMPGNVYSLGVLRDITLESGHQVAELAGAVVHLCASPDGDALYLVAPGGVRCNERTPTGRILAIAYCARKGADRRRVIYEHEFESPRPRFEIGRHGEPLIRRAGSSFRVEWRGIVG